MLRRLLLSFIDHAFRIWLPDSYKLAINWKKDNDVTIYEMTLPINFSDVAVFLLSSLVTGASFMSMMSTSYDTGSRVMTISEIQKSE